MEPYLDIPLQTGATLRVQPITPYTFRLRLRQDGRFREPALIRYGILRNDLPPVTYTVQEGEEIVSLATSNATLIIQKADGRLTLQDGWGRAPYLQQTAAPWSDEERGFGAEFALEPGEKLYGLGDETRDRIQKRGHRTMMWVRNVSSYVPIPYLMSNRGWAIMVNTTWRHYFDVGFTRHDRLSFWGKRGELDYYIFIGRDLPTLLEHYTEIAGRPHLLPLWAYGLTFVCNQQADAREMLDDCLNFRREGIPCDLVGLEPGWMEKYYDHTVDKKWHPERFYVPYWGTKGPHTFLGAAERLGFKVSLWLCCNYDLSYEEERRAGNPIVVRQVRATAPNPDDFEQDQHFNPVWADQITKPEEPWFEHLKKFVDQGVSAFKLDGCTQVDDHPDRCWANGMSDEEMHNLYPTIYNKQMHLGFKEHTGRRPMIYTSGGYLGIQQYSATWAGDTGGGPKPLISMLNHALSGHVNTSCDMDVFTPEGIHFGFLQPWAQVCSWAYWRHPWLLGDKLGPIFKYYARLRYRLIPYLYSMAHVAARTGMPIMRPMPLAFPDDPRSDELLSQYMLGDSLLVGAFTEEIHLPQGEWVDFWTGQRYQGPQDLLYTIPEGRGGLLFVRAGAIIPNWPDMDYVGQKPLDALSLHVVPGKNSAFTLYEDDGLTFAWQQGEVARTLITCTTEGPAVTLTIAPREGAYAGMPARRSFEVWLYLDTPPQGVELNGQPLKKSDVSGGWRYDAANRAVRLVVEEDPARAKPVCVRYLL